MATLPAQDLSVDLRAVTVRPTWGAQEHRRWDRLVAEHHYLPFHGVIGKVLRHVAVHGETWLALIGWQPGAFKLAARDRWIGWPAEQQFRRLHLIANNSRFVILTPGRVHNLASRVLGLSLRRLSQDIQAVHGYPVFLAETFVDVSRFVGTCYRASNWRSLGLTRGFAREPGGSARWRHHGQPKEIFVFELTDAAAEALSRTEVPAHWNAEQHTEPMAAPRLRSLFECLGEVPECRRDRGKRYPLNTVLAIAVAARLAGYRGVNAFAQFAALLSQEQLEAVGAFWSPSKQRYTAPAITTFHNILAALPPETLDNAIGQWTGQHSTAHAPVAMDGKDLRGASKQTEDGRRMMVAAVEHDSGMVLGQVEVDSKSNEIPAVRELSSSLDLAGRIVTVDAMHAQHETARCLLGRRADYVISAIKDNQETILEDLKAIDFSDAPWHETVDKGHGRIERRRREPRRNGAWYRIVLHHPSRLPGDASLVPLSWRAASCRSGIHRYLRSRYHPAPGTLGYPRARGDRAGPSQPKSQGQGRRPGCDLRGRGGAHKTPGPGGQRPFRHRGSPAGAANNAKDGNQVPPRGPAATPQHHRCRTGGSA